MNDDNRADADARSQGNAPASDHAATSLNSATGRGSASSHLPLSVPVYQILLSLADGSLHGYAVIKDIDERTAGEVRLTASTLYAAIKRLVGAGMIEETAERAAGDDDPRRRYYLITDFGTEVLTEEAMRLERAAAMARSKNVLPELAPRRSR